MKISIITVTYNSAATLRDTIESVLSQDYPSIEFIIVDGVSTDSTLEIINEYGTKISKVVSEPDKGIYDAMNKGISMATGDAIGILNSDDFFYSNDVISTIVRAFEEHKDIDGVYGDLYYVNAKDTDKIIRYWHSKPFHEYSFYHGWNPAHPTLYVRRQIYEKYGVFDLRFPLSADFELMLRLFECCKIRTKYIEKVMVKMRIGGATSKSLKPVLKGISQCERAFRANGLRPPLLYPFYRLVPKLIQFIRRKK